MNSNVFIFFNLKSFRILSFKRIIFFLNLLIF